jgi:hypothetical protein
VPRSVDDLAKEVLGLSPELRTGLLDRVVASLDTGDAGDTAAAWDALAARREAELASGQVKAVPLEDALGRLRAVLE